MKIPSPGTVVIRSGWRAASVASNVEGVGSVVPSQTSSSRGVERRR